ncbi:MAG: hypothetical protein IJO32_07585 [Bacilli bacterium]|nr:hypothetical protein [Bacilli bacterium]
MNINKQIFKLIFEILFTSLIIVINISARNNSIDIQNKVFAFNNRLNAIEFKQLNQMNATNIFPISNDDALNKYEKSIFQISNKNNNNIRYRFIYRVYKSSTVEIDWFNFYFKIDENETIDNLSNQKINNTDDYTDIILYEGNLNSNEIKEIEFLIWLDYNIGNEAQNKVLRTETFVDTI